MPDYRKSKVYKLVSNQTDKIYVGSTTQPLCERKAGHKQNYRKYLSGKYHYVTSFEIVKYEDCDIVLLEEINCENKMHLHAKEREYIEKLECCNKNIPTRSKKEYYEIYKITHKEHITKYNNKYIKEKPNFIYRKCLCICGSVYKRNNDYHHCHTKKHVKFMQFYDYIKSKHPDFYNADNKLHEIKASKK